MRLYQDQPSGTVDHARALRREASPPERRLLRGLRDAFPRLKWRHQAPVGPYYADILCLSEQLVIEVDGDTHAALTDQDGHRAAYMAREGLRTIRVTNADAANNLDGVLTQIALSLRKGKGAPQARKGEGDHTNKGELAPANSPSPSHAAARRGPLLLPMGEEA